MKIQHLIPILFLAAFCTVSAQTNNAPATTNTPSSADSQHLQSDADFRQKILGTWEGSRTNRGMEASWGKAFETFRSNGCFTEETVVFTKGLPESNTLSGFWQINNGILEMNITNMVSGTNNYASSARSTNKLIRIDAHEMVVPVPFMNGTNITNVTDILAIRRVE